MKHRPEHDAKNELERDVKRTSERDAENKPKHDEKGQSEHDAERLLAEQLTEGELKGRGNPEEEAVRRLPPRWEIRIQAQYDPVAEETARYREIAREVDGRYDRVQPDQAPAKKEERSP